MTIIARLEHWREHGAISPEQQIHLAGLCRGEPFSLFLELNILLYAGVLTFVAGLGWTVTTWSQQIGDVVVLAVLSAILGACFWYCFSRAPVWSAAETPALSPILDYVLYLGSLVWCIELAYLENRLHVLSGQGDLYLLATTVFFFFLAYRFDNRFVLSLALSSLAGWFGLTISHWPSHQDAAYRQYALLYCVLIGVGGMLLQRRGLKAHFFGTYLNIVANVLFWALLSGVFDRQTYGLWFLALLIACGLFLYGSKSSNATFLNCTGALSACRAMYPSFKGVPIFFTKSSSRYRLISSPVSPIFGCRYSNTTLPSMRC